MIPKILIFALMMVESGGDTKAIGDNGNAFGCLQIWEAYVIDANEFAGTTYKHEDAFDKSAAISICRSYMQRYANEKRLGRPVTAEDVARIHNGGPNGYKNPATEKYWVKVRNQLIAMGQYELALGKPLTLTEHN